MFCSKMKFTFCFLRCIYLIQSFQISPWKHFYSFVKHLLTMMHLLTHEMFFTASLRTSHQMNLTFLQWSRALLVKHVPQTNSSCLWLHWTATRQWEVWPKCKAMIPVDFLCITFPIKEGECKLTYILSCACREGPLLMARLHCVIQVKYIFKYKPLYCDA